MFAFVSVITLSIRLTLNPKVSNHERSSNYVITKKTIPDSRVYESPRIYLPTKLTTDSNFPFGKGTMLHVRLEGRKLIVEPAAMTVLRRFGKLRKITSAIGKKPRKK
ncbi:MAG: hypothetical protein ACLPY5_06995 [Candidatus Bathyarchaeia archaeon]